MVYKKFDVLQKNEYRKKYFERDKEFYDEIKEHLWDALGKRKTVGIDIGAGPGISAIILSRLQINTTLTGYEPSNTADEGKKLSKELSCSKSLTKYSAIKKSIQEIKTPIKNSLDYILILRAAHEIAESLGSKDRFFIEIKRILTGLKRLGIVLIADQQYAEEFKSDGKIIQKVQKYQELTIGHSHVPSDYVEDVEMKKMMRCLGLKLIKKSTVPNNALLHYLQNEKCTLKKSPCYFYICTFEKK